MRGLNLSEFDLVTILKWDFFNSSLDGLTHWLISCQCAWSAKLNVHAPAITFIGQAAFARFCNSRRGMNGIEGA